MDAENQCARCGRYLYSAHEAETAKELYRLTGARFPETQEIAVVLIGEQKHATSPQIAAEIERLRAELAELQDGYSRLSRDFALAIESDSKHIAELVAARRSIEIYQGCLLAEQEHSEALEAGLKECRSKPQDLHLHANGGSIDCRTCAHYMPPLSIAGDPACELVSSVIVCISGDGHAPADPVRLYETGGE